MNNKTINAQELIDFITKHKSAIFNEYDCYKDHIQSKIKWNMRNDDMFNKLITVINGMATEIKHGHWKYYELDNYQKYKVVCSNCGAGYTDNYDGYIQADDFEYCPNCGSIMNEDFEHNELVHCIDCKYLVFSDFYGECSQAYKGIVKPDDYCGYGVNKHKESEKDNGK